MYTADNYCIDLVRRFHCQWIPLSAYSSCILYWLSLRTIERPGFVGLLRFTTRLQISVSHWCLSGCLNSFNFEFVLLQASVFSNTGIGIHFMACCDPSSVFHEIRNQDNNFFISCYQGSLGFWIQWGLKLSQFIFSMRRTIKTISGYWNIKEFTTSRFAEVSTSNITKIRSETLSK